MKQILPDSLLPLLFLFALVMCTAEDPQTENESEETSFFSATQIEENRADIPNRLDSPEVTQNQAVHAIENSRTNAITTAVESASDAIVSITATEVLEQRRTPQDQFFRHFFGLDTPTENSSMGSGFIISEDGLVVTNQHVVGQNPNNIMISMTSGKSYEATLVGSDEFSDLALLKIESDHIFPFVDFSDSDDVIVGEWAIALGNPFGLFDDGNPTVTVGVVSAKNRDFRPNPNNPRVYIDMIQTDAAINRGNSGGPLLNSEGKVIGINTFIFTGGTSSGFIGLGFAIPSNRVQKIASQLLSSGVVNLDYDPGMEFTSMTEQLVYRYQLPYVQGLLVTSVNKDGPAYECGVMPGDVIVKIGDERVVSEMHARALLREYKIGDSMPLEIIRNQNHYKTEMKLRNKINAESKTD